MSQTMTAPAGRLGHLDALRGFALLGIALMNVEFFTTPLADMGQGVGAGQGPLDRAADWLVYVLVQGKFWSLFSLLFGMGFVLMLDRAHAAGARFVPTYLRRCLGLLAIGLAHALLVWAGDILVSYALGALVLLLVFRNTSAGTMLAWGIALWVLPVGMYVMGGVAMAQAGPEQLASFELAPAFMEQLRAQELAAYSAGSWAEATAARIGFLHRMLPNELFLLPILVGVFLVGGWLARSGVVLDPRAHRRSLLRLAMAGCIVGGLLTAGSLRLTASPVLEGPGAGEALLAAGLHLAGGLPLALAYAATFLLLATRAGPVTGVLAPAGRMALTNYLLQSLVGTWIFYGHGLGLWGEVGRAGQVAGVLTFFALQVAASHWWLARFHQGPVEWAWRVFTYGRRMPLRREAVAGAA